LDDAICFTYDGRFQLAGLSNKEPKMVAQSMHCIARGIAASTLKVQHCSTSQAFEHTLLGTKCRDATVKLTYNCSYP